LFVVEQAGRILIITKGTVLSEPFLDIRGRVNSNSLEQGLLSVAFHPNYSQNGQIYVNYTNLQGNTVVARYLVRSDDHNIADPNGETVLLTIAQPHANHNGGQVSFGPDGALYIGMGDGGSAGDPSNHGQDRSTLLGAMLRLDVDSNEPYALRTDNPFLGMSSVRNEIWATGLRNPWRFSFDRLTGDLYVADVGQNLWEEVNFQHAGGSGGENYGWRVMEASYCYASDSCDMAGLTMPVGEYSHQEGCSVTGGYVYRGQAYPELRGNYFFGDYCTGNVWSLFHNPDGSWQQALVLKSGINISSFGEDAAGELYLLDYVGGIIYQIGS
jgi:glucose/arabinose dehydrogenase